MRAAFVLIPALAIAACGFCTDAQEGEAGSYDGRAAQRAYDVGAFDSVSLGGHHNVVVDVGPAASVRAEGPASELDRLKIEVEDGDLHIGTKDDRKWFGSSRSRRPVTIYVTTPTLTAASIGGSGDMRIDSADVSIMGSGDVAISGTARCSVSKMGSGDVRCGG